MEAGNGRGAGLPTLPPPPPTPGPPPALPSLPSSRPVQPVAGGSDRSPRRRGKVLVSVCIVSPPPHAAPNGETEARRTGGGLSCADPQTTAALGLGVGRAWGHPLWSASGGGGGQGGEGALRCCCKSLAAFGVLPAPHRSLRLMQAAWARSPLPCVPTPMVVEQSKAPSDTLTGRGALAWPCGVTRRVTAVPSAWVRVGALLPF